MVDLIQELRKRLDDHNQARIAIELNTSCPNIHGSPPPAYSFPSLEPLLDVLASYNRRDPSLTIGLKLAPYVSSRDFKTVVDVVASFSRSDASRSTNPFKFFTCTNTLGSSLLFADQTTSSGSSGFALPPILGGLAGESIHALSLGNVYTFSQLLSTHADEAMRTIKIIGVGGVTSREAVKRMRDVGASVVGCATFLGREGVSGFEKLS